MTEPIYTAIIADDQTTTAFLTETLEKLIANYGIERVLVDTSNNAGTLIATLAAEKGLDFDLFDTPIYGIDADAAMELREKATKLIHAEKDVPTHVAAHAESVILIPSTQSFTQNPKDQSTMELSANTDTKTSMVLNALIKHERQSTYVVLPAEFGLYQGQETGTVTRSIHLFSTF